MNSDENRPRAADESKPNGANRSAVDRGSRNLIGIGVLAFATSVFAQSAFATIRYVDQANVQCSDSGTGTQQQPYCTISAAAAVVVAGDAVEVESGVYNEQVTVPRSGAAGAPIIFKAAPGATVNVKGQTNGFRVSTKSYITIQNFTVSDTSSYSFYVSNGNNIILANNHATRAGQPVSGLTSYCIYMTNVADSLVTGNTVDYCTNGGIYLTGGSTRIRVVGNVSHHNASVYIRQAAGIHIRAPGNTIEGNTSYDNEDSGINLYPGSDNSLTVNNITYNNGDHGIDNNTAPGQRIIGNTVYNNVTAGINVEGGASGATLANNISVNNGLDSNRTVGNIRIDDSSQAGTIVDYDIVDLTQPGVMMVWGTSDYSSLSAFTVATGQEIHGIQADPQWVDPVVSDFHLLSGSPAIDSANSGANGALAYDVRNLPRTDDPGTLDTGIGPRNYDDRGAYEFNPETEGDTLPPSSPENLVAIPVSAFSSVLSWDASTDNIRVVGYRLSRGTVDGGPYEQVAVTASTAYFDSGLVPATPYYYVVAAYDAAGNVSIDSNQASAITLSDSTAPVRSGASPSGTLLPGTSQATIGLTTDEDATCKYSLTADVEFENMSGFFSATGAKSHSTLVSGLQDGTDYNYYVRCQDLQGNANSDDYLINFSVAAENDTLVFMPTDDATILADSPNTNHGHATTIVVDKSPMSHFLLKFNLTGLGTTPIQSATLYLYDVNNSYTGGQFHLADNTVYGNPWSESTVTWNTAPAYDSAVCASCSLGRVLDNTWYPVDITPLVSGDGILSLRVTSTSPDAAAYESIDAATNRPYLVVVLNNQPPDVTLPTVSIEAPADGASISGTVSVTAVASDDVGVVGVQFLLDGGALGAEDATKPFGVDWDSTTTTNGVHQLTAVARDAAGNIASSGVTDVTVDNVPVQTLSFVPEADSYIAFASPTKNYGTRTSVWVDNSPITETLMKFSVSGVGNGTVISAKLRLYANNSSDNGGDLHLVTDNSWTETGLTWNNAPVASPDLIANLGEVRSTEWVEVDVASVITSDGLYSFRLTSPSADAAGFDSKEAAGSNGPQLVVEYSSIVVK